MYAYVGGNPINWIDPWGLVPYGDLATGIRDSYTYTGNQEVDAQNIADMQQGVRDEYDRQREIQDQIDQLTKDQMCCFAKCMVGVGGGELITQSTERVTGNAGVAYGTRKGFMIALRVTGGASTLYSVGQAAYCLSKCQNPPCNSCETE